MHTYIHRLRLTAPRPHASQPAHARSARVPRAADALCARVLSTYQLIERLIMTKDPTFNINHDKGYVSYENVSQTDEIIIIFEDHTGVILPKTVTKMVNFTGKKNYNLTEGRPGKHIDIVENQQGGKVELTLDRRMLDKLKVVHFEERLETAELLDANALEDLFSDNAILAISLGFINGVRININFLTNSLIEKMKLAEQMFPQTKNSVIEGRVEKEVLMTKDIVVFTVIQ